MQVKRRLAVYYYILNWPMDWKTYVKAKQLQSDCIRLTNVLFSAYCFDPALVYCNHRNFSSVHQNLPQKVAVSGARWRPSSDTPNETTAGWVLPGLVNLCLSISLKIYKASRSFAFNPPGSCIVPPHWTIPWAAGRTGEYTFLKI